ncbi:Protein of unknown function [Pyronema omphalodes CBS 100304]|uniref:Uncharacterized protein n=1 Tax=Pyronema omphalodes (strain CBS 100304) TaxID=1076935 RepID=U4LS55_PYROM|nr:Protein of unknown function [Pyronema omphalodes CBS 100304]
MLASFTVRSLLASKNSIVLRYTSRLNRSCEFHINCPLFLSYFLKKV